MNKPSYVPYQAYKPKRHSRTGSTPLAVSNGMESAAIRSRHFQSASLGVPRTESFKEKEAAVDMGPAKARMTERPEYMNGGCINGAGPAQQQHNSELNVQVPSPEVPAREVVLSLDESANLSEPVSPISLGGHSTSSAPLALSNGDQRDDASEPSSPTSNRSVPTLQLASSSNATSASNTSVSSATTSPEAGPSTPSPVPPKLASATRKSSTYRHVPLRSAAGSTPRMSSPLKPPGDQPRPLSSTLPRSESTLAGQANQSNFRAESAASLSSPPSQSQILGLTGTTAPSSLMSNGNPAVNVMNRHQHSTSLLSSPIPERYVPPQRTSSLPVSPSSSTPPPLPPKPAVSAPDTPVRSNSSSPVVTPGKQYSPLPASSGTLAHKTAYRPGFQPKGVYRPLTHEFLVFRKQARETGRVERARLERRFEKLVNLHFALPPENKASSIVKVNGIAPKGKEKQALSRRPSSLFDLDFRELRNKSAGELWREVVDSRSLAFQGEKNDIRAAEQKITPWQDDAEVSACPLCFASFHPLTNRKHHCRLCGRIICSLPVKIPQRPAPCSLLFVVDPRSGQIEEVSEFVDYGIRPRSAAESPMSKTKSGMIDEKASKGVRICKECKPVLLRQQYWQEAKRVPSMVRFYEVFISLESEIEVALPQFQELLLSLENNSNETPSKDASAARKHLLQCFADYDAIAKRIRNLPCPEGQGSSQDRIQAAILARANMFLQKNMFPLQSLPKSKKPMTTENSAADGSVYSEAENDGQIIDPDSDLAQILQPLLEQEALLESFIEEATAHRKFEDAKTLKTNLGEIRAEIDRIVARADSRAAMAMGP